MKLSTLLPMFLLTLTGISSPVLADPFGLTVNATGDEAEKAKDVLEKALNQYPSLGELIYTKKVNIESGILPHSTPILTLKAEEYRKPDVLLGTFIHQELERHWKAIGNKAAMRKDLQEKYPTPPMQLPLSAENEADTYKELVLCGLEFQHLAKLIGEAKAKTAFRHKTYYTWIYKTVAKDSEFFAATFKKYGMDGGGGQSSGAQPSPSSTPSGH
jgi:hypothetical protein